jgi:hypothetical protein
VGGWIDDCAARGFDAVEPDNFDSYTRSRGLLTAHDTVAFIRLLSAHAHGRRLAVAQKNTAGLATDRARNGLDFAVAEECGAFGECGRYTAAYGDHVIDIEYGGPGLRGACAGWGDRLSIVRRDLDLVAPGDSRYLRETCTAARAAADR